MNSTERSWIRAGLPAEAYGALVDGLPAARLWSLLLSVMERRAAQRTPAAILQQWRAERFVQPCYVDQRILLDLDRHLLETARDFEAIELSPLAPLGTCSSVALASQNKIVATARGTEVVSDPTNVLALESARRLRKDASLTVKLATSHRCVRAQEIPRAPGFAAHFRMFCMTSAAHEQRDHAFLTAALVEHVNTHLRALDRLEQHGYRFPQRAVRLLASPEREHLARRIAGEVTGASVNIEPLRHGYYDGLRFMISARSQDGLDLPLIDGGSFDWLGKLAANRKLVFVASAIGSQLAAYMFRPGTS